MYATARIAQYYISVRSVGIWRSKSSHRRCSIKKAVAKIFSLFTGNHLNWSLFLIKLLAFRVATLLKRDFNTGAFLGILQNFEK